MIYNFTLKRKNFQAYSAHICLKLLHINECTSFIQNIFLLWSSINTIVHMEIATNAIKAIK